MYKKIMKLIKKYPNIVIARHIGVDPDALGSQLALKEAIEVTFPEKKVYAVGSGSTKFHYIGKLDKLESVLKDALLIVLDTPDKKRIDSANPDDYEEIIKIDHHPFMQQFASLEWIDDTASSACQMVIELIFNTKLKMNQSIAEKLYIGLVSDTNRFAFRTCTSKTFYLVSELLRQYPIDIELLYQKLFMRPLNEIRLQGYISQNLVVTDHGVGYVKLTGEVLSKFKADASTAGNMVNNFNYIEDFFVWALISEDLKNGIIKVNIRSRGPEINQIAERHNGGGHKFASGARVYTMEEAEQIIDELDAVSKKYIEENEK